MKDRNKSTCNAKGDNGGNSAYLHTLRRLYKERVALLEQLAPLMRRVSPSNPKRAQIEKRRTIERKQVRAALHSIEQEFTSVGCLYVQYLNQRRADKRAYQRELMQKRRFAKRVSGTIDEGDYE